MDETSNQVNAYAFQPRYTAEEIEERRARRRQEEERAAAYVDLDVNASDDDESDPDDDPEDRLHNTEWCSCNQCEVPANPSVEMCVCCQEQEYAGLTEKLDSPDHIIPCITAHSDFRAIALTNAVLQMLAAHTREKRGYPINEEWTNRYVTCVNV